MTILENKYINIDTSDIAEVLQTIKSKQLSGTASVVKEYECVLSSYFGIKHAFAVSSGTAALHLLMYLYNIKTGDEVIVPPTAPVMSVLPIVAVGATPVFVDVCHESFKFNFEDFVAKVSSCTKAIVCVPMWGYPVHDERISKYAKSKGIPIIEDASHCHGAKYDDSFIGTLSDVSFFSTQERKLISTGEGGFILTRNDFIAQKIEELRDFGKVTEKNKVLQEYAGHYGHGFGLNFRISAMSAALGITQTQKLNSKIRKRTDNSSYLKNNISILSWIKEMSFSLSCTPNYYSMIMFVDHFKYTASEISEYLYRNDVISDTFRFGIKPLYELPIFNEYYSDCPNASSLLKSIITLPTHEGLTKDDLDYICKLLSDLS